MQKELKKHLYAFFCHLDDFELAYFGYLSKYFNKYDKIVLVCPTTWEPKVRVWNDNLNAIKGSILERYPNLQEEDLLKLEYHNLGYEQRSLNKNFEEMKDQVIKQFDFSPDVRFDILTHDLSDCHTDHVALARACMGLYKYAERYVTVYSPSTHHFEANFWVELPEEVYRTKMSMLNRYNIESEQSYTKLGYYLQSEKHFSLGDAYYMENFVHDDENHHEAYRIIKWKS